MTDRCLEGQLVQEFEGAFVSLTVVIPAFNEEAYIAATLESCLRAAERLPSSSVKIIVVDDQSTDRTAAVAASFGVEVRAGMRKGIGAARNFGAAEVGAGTVVFVDADTIMDDDTLEAISREVASGARFGAVAPVYRSQVIAVRALMSIWAWYARHRSMTQGVCQFFLASDFRELGGYDESIMMAEDTDINERFISTYGRDVMSVITSSRVYPSMRRYEQWGSLRSWIWTNPLVTKFFRQSPEFWKGWYIDPPR